MSDRHELFEELDAFNPNWQEDYKTLLTAVMACADSYFGYYPGETPVVSLWEDWLSTPDGQKYCELFDGVYDTKGAIEALQQAEAESSLPFKLSNIGSVPRGT